MTTPDFIALAELIKLWGRELGFQQVGIADIDVAEHSAYLQQWLTQHYHGEMSYMLNHANLRSQPEQLVPGTLRVISARMDYLPVETQMVGVLQNPEQAYVSRYALGRDYHKLIRRRLQQLATRIQQHIGEFGYRAFVDSAPVLERALAEKAGLGWIGKNTCLIHPQKGSLFLLGEIITSLELSNPNPMLPDFCGSCNRCIQACPTQAIVADKKLDARKCISYLTIESRKVPDIELRVKMGDWFFGCDICQTVCPWNQKIFKAFAYPASHEALPQRPLLADQRQKLVQDLSFFLKASGKQIQKKVRSTPLARAGAFGLRRNAMVVAGNQNLTELRGEIESYLQNEKLSDLAKWTLARWQDLELEDRN